jgi:hypothetical protein
MVDRGQIEPTGVVLERHSTQRPQPIPWREDAILNATLCRWYCGHGVGIVDEIRDGLAPICNGESFARLDLAQQLWEFRFCLVCANFNLHEQTASIESPRGSLPAEIACGAALGFSFQ